MKTDDIEVSLAKISDLFTEPEFLLASPSIGKPSGIEQIRERVLRIARWHDSYTFTLRINDREGCSEEHILIALKRFCENRIQENDTQIALVRRDGRRLLLFAILSIIAASIVLYALVLLIPGIILSFFGSIFIQMFVLAAWVILWSPIEELAFSWRPYRHENIVYEILLRSQVQVT